MIFVFLFFCSAFTISADYKIPDGYISLFGQSAVLSSPNRLEVFAFEENKKIEERQKVSFDQGQTIDQDMWYRSMYQMSLRSFHNLMDKSVQDFLTAILDDRSTYRDEVLVLLAAEYIKQHKRKKDHVADAVVQELARREKRAALYQAQAEKQQEADRQAVRLVRQQEKFAQKMKQLGCDVDQLIYLPTDGKKLEDDYLFCQNLYHNTARQKAAQKSLDQKLAQSVQTVSLTSQAQAFLMHKGLNPQIYQDCYGTALQHQLHQEVCSSFEIIAESYRHQLSSSAYLDMALAFCDTAFMATEYEVLPLACYLQDVGRACQSIAGWIIQKVGDYSVAILEGSVQSGKEFAHMISHPVETIANMGRAVLFILETIALANPNYYHCSDSQVYFDDYLKPLQKAREEQIDNLVLAGYQSFKNCSDVDLVRCASRLGTDCFLQHKLIQTMGAFAGVVRSQSKNVRSFEYVLEAVGQEPEFAGTAQRLFEFQEELEKDIGRNIGTSVGITPVAESSKISQAAEVIKVRPISEIQKDIAKYGGKIPLHDAALCQEVITSIQTILEEINYKIDIKFKNVNSWKWIIEDGVKKKINLDIEHIINYGANINRNKLTQSLTFTIDGGHLAGSAELLESKGLVKILKKNDLGNGAFEYKMEDVFCKQSITKTEFPKDWDYKKIVESCWEVYENPLYSRPCKKGNKTIKQKIVNECKVEIIVKSHDKTSNIITAYSVKEFDT